MRKVLILAAMATLAACNSNKDTKDEPSSMSSASDSTTTKKDDIAYPYTANYSSKFEIGNPQYAKIILDLYKDWDNNTLENSKNSFADVDSLIFADGSMIAGSRDSVYEAIKKIRNTMGILKNEVDAWVPLKSTDRNENWVAVWTKETITAANGKKNSTYLQETWRINKDGKVDLVFQFAQKPPAPPKK
jgi:hypothetical protein